MGYKGKSNKEYQREYYLKNKDDNAEKHRKYYEKNREKILHYNEEYRNILKNIGEIIILRIKIEF